KGLLIWLFDFLALCWFARVFLEYFVLGKSLDDGPNPHRRSGRWLVLGLLAGFVIDAGISVAVLLDERDGYQSAAVTTGAVTRIEPGHERPVARLRVTFEFRDAQGNLHSAFTIIHRKDRQFPPELSQETQARLMRGEP